MDLASLREARPARKRRKKSTATSQETKASRQRNTFLKFQFHQTKYSSKFESNARSNLLSSPSGKWIWMQQDGRPTHVDYIIREAGRHKVIGRSTWSFERGARNARRSVQGAQVTYGALADGLHHRVDLNQHDIPGPLLNFINMIESTTRRNRTMHQALRAACTESK